MEKIKKFLSLDVICAIIILVSILLLFCPMGYYFYANEKSYISTGMNMIFGYKDQGYPIMDFSIVGFVLLVFLILALIAQILPFFKWKEKNLLLAIFDLTCGVVYYCLPISVIHGRVGVADLYHGNALLYISASLLVVTTLINLYVYIKARKNNTKEVK